MKSITRMFCNHDNDLGSSVLSHRHLSDGWPANPSNTPFSVNSRER